jgi:hypothetical protein
MRIRTLASLLLLGGGVATIVARSSRRARRANEPEPVAREDLNADPGDPVQGFDEASELYVEPLDFDAQSAADAEAAQDLATLESELEEQSLELDTPSQTDVDAIANATRRDGGDLYGVHVPRAVDRKLPDDDQAFEAGEHWLEALEASAAENGAEPERELDIIDESDEDGHRSSDMRDIPVADRGSAGPRGL